MEELTIINDTPFYLEPDITKTPMFILPRDVEVTMLSKNDVWYKVEYRTYKGYIKRKDASISSEKFSKIMISIPKEHAVSLYEALKFSLKK